MIVTYKLSGKPPAFLHESKHRVAQFCPEMGCWELFQKIYQGNPISDWEYEDLIYLVSVPEDQEDQVVVWVETGRLSLFDLPFDSRSELRRHAAEKLRQAKKIQTSNSSPAEFWGNVEKMKSKVEAWPDWKKLVYTPKDLENVVLDVVSQQKPIPIESREIVTAVQSNDSNIQPTTVLTVILNLLDRGQLELTKDLKIRGKDRK